MRILSICICRITIQEHSQLKNNEIDFTFVEPSQIKELEADENLDVYVIGSADYRCVMYNFQVCDLV